MSTLDRFDCTVHCWAMVLKFCLCHTGIVFWCMKSCCFRGHSFTGSWRPQWICSHRQVSFSLIAASLLLYHCSHCVMQSVLHYTSLVCCSFRYNRFTWGIPFCQLVLQLPIIDLYILVRPHHTVIPTQKDSFLLSGFLFWPMCLGRAPCIDSC